MVILGIDPSLNSCGFALIRYNSKEDRLKYLNSGVIVAKNEDFYIKLKNIMNIINGKIIEHQPVKLIMEESFVNTNYASSLKLSIVRGVIISLALQHNIDIKEHTPNYIKQIITGNGKATKDQVSYMAEILLGKSVILKDLKNDETDAIAIAIAGCMSNDRF